MTLPEIEINFKQRAATAIKRSEKGIVCFVCQDTELAKYEYTSPLGIEDLNATNEALVKQAFLGEPNKVIVITVASDGSFSDALDLLNQTKFNWLVCNIAADQADVVSYAKSRGCKTVVYNNSADDMHIVNFTTTSVTFDDDTTQNGIDYIARIAGLLAGLPFTRSATYYTLTDLKSCVDVSNPADTGEFYLINDEGVVRCGRALNSLTTLGTDKTEDMQSICIVEAMDVIQEDIFTEFKNNYIGKYKNKYDNQRLFISAVNGYFKRLAKEDILDDSYNNVCDVDIKTQRDAWTEVGKTEAVDWEDIEVKKNTFKTKLFLLCDVKILNAIEDMKFVVEMF